MYGTRCININVEQFSFPFIQWLIDSDFGWLVFRNAVLTHRVIVLELPVVSSNYVAKPTMSV